MAQGGIPNPDPSKNRGKHRMVPMTELAPASAGAKRRKLNAKRDWHPETLEWWTTWTHSPQSSQFLESDWRRLRQVARLVDLYYLACDEGAVSRATTLSGEIRLNEALFGATPIDRLRLRWKVGGETEPQVRSGRSSSTRGARRRDPRLSLVEGAS